MVGYIFISFKAAIYPASTQTHTSVEPGLINTNLETSITNTTTEEWKVWTEPGGGRGQPCQDLHRAVVVRIPQATGPVALLQLWYHYLLQVLL